MGESWIVLDDREYPESEHFLREADWHDLWGRTLMWLRRYLAAASP